MSNYNELMVYKEKQLFLMVGKGICYNSGTFCTTMISSQKFIQFSYHKVKHIMSATILQAINIIEGNYFAQNKKSTN